MPALRLLLKLALVVACLLAVLVVFGAMLWFVISLFDGRAVSPAAAYAVWFVAGVFAGFVHYSGAMAACAQTTKAGVAVPPPPAGSASRSSA